MAFTEAQLQAQLDTDGLNCKITAFSVGATTTDVYVQNANITTAKKSGMTQCLNTLTAAQAAAAIRTNLS